MFAQEGNSYKSKSGSEPAAVSLFLTRVFNFCFIFVNLVFFKPESEFEPELASGCNFGFAGGKEKEIFWTKTKQNKTKDNKATKQQLKR